MELADYCPFYQAFTWRDPHSENPLHRDSRCELEFNTPSLESNTILEVYGKHSRCFDLGVIWTEKRCARIKSYTQFLAGCYAVSLFTCTSVVGNKLDIYQTFCLVLLSRRSSPHTNIEPYSSIYLLLCKSKNTNKTGRAHLYQPNIHIR